MMSYQKLKFLYELFQKNELDITCQDEFIQAIYKKFNFSMDKKTQLKNLIQSIKDGLKKNNPVNNDPSNWIGISDANKLTAITRPSLYNIVAEGWVDSKKGVNSKNQNATLIFKPQLMAYHSQTTIIDKLIEIGFIKVEIDELTGKKRYLQIQLETGASKNLDGEVKLKALYKIYIELQDLFRNVDLDEFYEFEN